MFSPLVLTLEPVLSLVLKLSPVLSLVLKLSPVLSLVLKLSPVLSLVLKLSPVLSLVLKLSPVLSLVLKLKSVLLLVLRLKPSLPIVLWLPQADSHELASYTYESHNHQCCMAYIASSMLAAHHGSPGGGSVTVTDHPTGQRTILLWTKSMERWSVAR